jgi:hypothetical protein
MQVDHRTLSLASTVNSVVKNFPWICRKLTLAGRVVAPEISFPAPLRTRTVGHERQFTKVQPRCSGWLQTFEIET